MIRIQRQPRYRKALFRRRPPRHGELIGFDIMTGREFYHDPLALHGRPRERRRREGAPRLGRAGLNRNTMAKVHIGDTFLIYARQDHAGGEVKPSAVMGAYQVVSAPFEDATPIFAAPPFLPGEVFPIRVKLRPLPEITAPVEFKPLVPELRSSRTR